MKKRNIILITALLFVLYGGYCAYACIKYLKEPNIRDILKNDCENYYAGKVEGLSNNIKNFCENTYLKKDGFLSMHYILVLDKFNPVCLPVVAITMALSIIWISIFFKNKVLLYYETRVNYKKVLQKILKEAYRFIWILPVVMLGVFLIEIYYQGLDCSLSLISQNTGWSDMLVAHPILFIVLYLINMLFYLSVFTNIALVWVRINKNYFISIIASFLMLISIQLFLEYFIDIVSTVNLLNFFRFNDQYGVFIALGFGILCCFLSWIAVYFAYRNKEKLYLDINR